MILLCLTRAGTALAMASAVIVMHGCNSRSVAENKGTAYLVPTLRSTVAGRSGSSDRSGIAAMPELDAGAERLIGPTPIELRHFNAYQNFRAVLEACAGDQGSTADNQSDFSTSGDSGTLASFVCPGGSLIRLEDE